MMRNTSSGRKVRTPLRTVIVSVFCFISIAELGSVVAQQPAGGSEIDGLAAAAAFEQVFVRVIEQAESSVVSISRIQMRKQNLAHFENGFQFRPFGGNNQNAIRDLTTGSDFIPNEFGAGIIIAPTWNPTDRKILTNYHVVKGIAQVGSDGKQSETKLVARFSDRRRCDVTIEAADPRSDLAVLKIDFKQLGVAPADLKPIRFASRPNLRKGQIVLTLGNPYAIARDGSASASWGMISNLDRHPAPAGPAGEEETIRKQTLHHFGTLLQIDNRLDLGSSGGAVLNLKGELIGISTSLAALEGYEKSVGYAIPVDDATLRIIDSLSRGHEVEYGFLGIQPKDVDRAALERQSGGTTFQQHSAAGVGTVFDQLPADRAGLLPDDVILEVNDRPVYGQYDLMRYIGQLGPESVARLLVWRKNQRQREQQLNLNVKLGKWPVYDDEGIIASVPRYPNWRGLKVDYPTARHKHLQLPYHRYFQSVLVTKIEEQSSAGRSELKEGDFITHVNQTPVKTPAEFHRAVRGVNGEVKLELVGRRSVVLSLQ